MDNYSYAEWEAQYIASLGNPTPEGGDADMEARYAEQEAVTEEFEPVVDAYFGKV